MADGIPTGDKAVFAFLEMVALAFAFEGVNALLGGSSWRISVGALIGAVLFFLLGIKWPKIRAAISSRNPSVGNQLSFWVGAIVLTWVPIGFDYYDRHTAMAQMPIHWKTPSKFVEIHDRVFVNEVVQLDNCSYTNCKFMNVSFEYNGTGPFQLNHIVVAGAHVITKSDAVQATIYFLKGINFLRPDLPVTFGPEHKPLVIE